MKNTNLHKIKIGVKILSDNIQEAKTQDEIQKIINDFLYFIFVQKKSNRKDFALAGIFNYFLRQKVIKRKLEAVETKAIKKLNSKKLTLKDYTKDIIELREFKDLSYQQIADYVTKYYKIKTSKSAIARLLKGENNAI